MECVLCGKKFEDSVTYPIKILEDGCAHRWCWRKKIIMDVFWGVLSLYGLRGTKRQG